MGSCGSEGSHIGSEGCEGAVVRVRGGVQMNDAMIDA